MFVPDNNKVSEGKKEKNLCGVLAQVEAGRKCGGNQAATVVSLRMK